MLTKKDSRQFRKNPKSLIDTRWKYLLPSTREDLIHIVAIQGKKALAVTMHDHIFRTWRIPIRELTGRFSPFTYLGKADDMDWLCPGGWIIAKNPIRVQRDRGGAWQIDRIERSLVICRERLRPNENDFLRRNLFIVIAEYREATAEEREEGRRLALMPAPRMPEPPTDEEVQAALDAAQAEAEPEVERQPFWKNLVEEDV